MRQTWLFLGPPPTPPACPFLSSLVMAGEGGTGPGSRAGWLARVVCVWTVRRPGAQHWVSWQAAAAQPNSRRWDLGCLPGPRPDWGGVGGGSGLQAGKAESGGQAPPSPSRLSQGSPPWLSGDGVGKREGSSLRGPGLHLPEALTVTESRSGGDLPFPSTGPLGLLLLHL